jgi:ribonuclease HI
MHILYTDGGSRGNPGASACAFLLYDADNKLVISGGEYLNENTNNYAEYQGLLHGIRAALENGVTDLKVFMDSELIVMQANGAYQVKHPVLKELYKQLKEMKPKFASIKFVHVPRAENKEADRLVNEILDANI